MSAKAAFWISGYVMLALGVAESLVDGDAPWTFLSPRYFPHRLGARIIDVPKFACSLVVLVALGVLAVHYLARKLRHDA